MIYETNGKLRMSIDEVLERVANDLKQEQPRRNLWELRKAA